jgi:hypothetical protein
MMALKLVFYCGVGEGDCCCLFTVELYVLLLKCMQYRQGQKFEQAWYDP